MIYYLDLNFRYHIWVVYDFKWKWFELQSYISRRKLQFSYKFYLRPSSYQKVTIFLKQTETYAVWYGIGSAKYCHAGTVDKRCTT
jgi:hypothetical protein